MKHASSLVLLVAVLSACTSAQTTQPAGQSQAGQSQPAGPTQTTAGGGDGSSLAAAALAIKDVCTLMPTDLAAQIVPGGSAPQSQLFPPFMCTVSNQVSVLEVTIDGGFGAVEPVAGAEVIPGLGEGGYLERLLPDDAYLTVVLGKDPDAAIHVEVAGHDGKDHKDDAIAVAQAVIAKLH
jgi:hypothetical protein